MTDDILNGLLTYHEAYMAALEDMDHIHQLDDEHRRYPHLAADYAKGLEQYRASLGPVIERVFSALDDAGPATALLRDGVGAEVITLQLGRPGEDALDVVRGAPCAKDPREVLSALVASGRLVKPTVGRCARCKVVRPADELDAFRSTTSSETVYICHGPLPLPTDRLGLGGAIWWTDSWGQPCALEYSWT